MCKRDFYVSFLKIVVLIYMAIIFKLKMHSCTQNNIERKIYAKEI